MRVRISIRAAKIGLAVGVFLSTGLLGGCDAGKEGAESETTHARESAELQPASELQTTRVDMLKASLLEDPDNEQLLSALGDAHFESQHFKEAIPVYEKAKSLNPFNSDVLNDLGLSYFYVGETDKALMSINGATEADPTNKRAWLSKGFILMSVGRGGEAVSPLNKVKELDPGGPLAKEADRFLQRLETGS